MAANGFSPRSRRQGLQQRLTAKNEETLETVDHVLWLTRLLWAIITAGAVVLCTFVSECRMDARHAELMTALCAMSSLHQPQLCARFADPPHIISP